MIFQALDDHIAAISLWLAGLRLSFERTYDFKVNDKERSLVTVTRAANRAVLKSPS